MTEPLAALLTLTAFWLAVRDLRPERGLVVGALVLGVAALVRPQTLLCAPFLVLVLPRVDVAKLARSAVLASALALAPVLPWTARNCRVMDGCALVSTNARLEPRHRRLPARDRALRDAALVATGAAR